MAEPSSAGKSLQGASAKARVQPFSDGARLRWQNEKITGVGFIRRCGPMLWDLTDGIVKCLEALDLAASNIRQLIVARLGRGDGR